ncbi:Sec-independent protein translocase protein TatB [Wohlfahrtiimonas larvae]|uniref:Sec-independent protein translocase protein TatB n=1 Tax=Wohlfahrtiimonas larvae TaxID=1157986 RepID=A0ABP9MIE0_9GAMM|nr:Sec-independent protein translocase protein TatB [Wohlfahrtiimonas larvae]
MFGISFGEFAIIFVVALIVIGPQKLPETIRTVGSIVNKLRSFTNQVKDDVSKEFQVDDLKKSFLDTKDSFTSQIKDTTHLDEVKKSLQEARHATENSIRDSQKAFEHSVQPSVKIQTHPTDTKHQEFDPELHADLADYYDYHDDNIITEPPKNYSASIEYHGHAIQPESIEALQRICLARQFELFSQNEKDKLLTYQLKYAKQRELNSLSSIIDNYHDTLVELNHP